MFTKLLRKVGLIKPSIMDAIVVVSDKELRTLTQDRDNFVEMIHPDGYKSRHRVRLTIINGNQFQYKRDRLDYWEYLNKLVSEQLQGTLHRICIAGHLYRI